MSAREITMRHWTENGSIKQRHGAGPAGRAAFHFVRQARNDEAVVGKPFQIAQLLHMAIGNLAAGFVAFPDDRWVMRFEPALAGVHEGRVCGASICVPLWVLSWISSMAHPSPSGRSSRRKPGNSSHNSGAVSALL